MIVKRWERRRDLDLKQDSLRPFSDRTESNFTVTLLDLLTDLTPVQNLTEEVKKKKKEKEYNINGR